MLKICQLLGIEVEDMSKLFVSQLTPQQIGEIEQSRKATFPTLQQDLVSGTRAFGPKYFYGYGRTYFVNLYINF